jgi:Secretion system C-terminal sorting domain
MSHTRMKSFLLATLLPAFYLNAQTYHSWELTKSDDDVEFITILGDDYYGNNGNYIGYPVLLHMNKNTSKVGWAKKYQDPDYETSTNFPFFKMSPHNKIILGFMPDIWPSPVPFTSTVIVSSLDLQGIPEWSKKLMFGVQYNLLGISFDSQGNSLLLASGSETWNGNDEKMWVTSMDTLGNVHWVKSYTTDVYNLTAYKIDRFSSGIYTAFIYGDPSSLKGVSVISRLDENGNVIWSKIFKDAQGKYFDEFRCVSEDSNGDIIVVGYPEPHNTPYGDFGMVVKINPDGEILYSKMVREDSLLSVTMPFFGFTDQTNVVLGGSFYKDNNNDVAFAIKLDENGNKLYEQTYPHPLNMIGSGPWFNYQYQNSLYGIAKTSPKGYTLTGIAYRTPADKTEAFLIETDNDLVAPCNSESPANPFIVEDYPLTTVDVTLTVKDEVHNWGDAVILAKPYVLNDTIICQTTVGTEGEPALENGSFRIAPNPTSEAITITYLGISSKSPILQIVSPLAQILKTIALHENQTMHTISVTDLPTGLYFLQILENGQAVKSLKFVKE